MGALRRTHHWPGKASPHLTQFASRGFFDNRHRATRAGAPSVRESRGSHNILAKEKGPASRQSLVLSN
jgi:hypothetical protein